jgi:hypothetical protein
MQIFHISCIVQKETTDAIGGTKSNIHCYNFCRCLFKGKYDLGCIAKSNAKGPRSQTRKFLARQREESNKSESGEISSLDVSQPNRQEGIEPQASVPEKAEVAIQVSALLLAGASFCSCVSYQTRRDLRHFGRYGTGTLFWSSASPLFMLTFSFFQGTNCNQKNLSRERTLCKKKCMSRPPQVYLHVKRDSKNKHRTVACSTVHIITVLESKRKRK